MKLRTSLCNPAALRKDITRFAPVWVLYTVGLFMILTAVMIDRTEYYRTTNLAYSLSFTAVINLCYGLLNGQLLFGDLFNARHCNALHAMPLRRECWYVTHVVAGLLFALVPNLLMALVAMPMLGGGWTVALWWYLAAALQYLFFFGLAVLSALCVGNRFAMLLVYGIVNFFSLIIYWFYHTIYEPLLQGVYITEDPFVLWCPVWKMIEHDELIDVVRREVTVGFGYDYDYLVQSVTPGEGWGYLAICAAVGAVMLGVALLLYRRRKLESAGDFMAVRALEPVFLVLYTLCMAAFFQVFAELFGTDENIFLGLGLIIGCFTGRMLLMRTTRVFQLKGFLWFGIFAAAFILSLVLTWLDPLGVTRYIPATGDVREVRISTSYNPQFSDVPYLSDPADIDTVRRIHQLVLEGKAVESEDDEEVYYNNLSILYVMDHGTVLRRYDVACSSEAGQLAETIYTRPAYVLGTDDADSFAAQVDSFYFDRPDGLASGQIEVDRTNAAYVRGLVEAILADCAEGTMAQNYGYHEGGEMYALLEFCTSNTDGSGEWYEYRTITVYPDNRHTVAYLEENTYPAVEEEY